MVDVAAMRTNAELIKEELRADPAFRAEWQRTILGRAVATALVRYRGVDNLSQREPAERLGMRQPSTMLTRVSGGSQ